MIKAHLGNRIYDFGNNMKQWLIYKNLRCEECNGAGYMYKTGRYCLKCSGNQIHPIPLSEFK